MKQGDVCWYRFREPDKKRPVLILTRNSAIPYLTGLTVAPITSTVRGVPSEVLLTPTEDGMLRECVVNSHNLQTVPKRSNRRTDNAAIDRTTARSEKRN